MAWQVQPHTQLHAQNIQPHGCLLAIIQVMQTHGYASSTAQSSLQVASDAAKSIHMHKKSSMGHSPRSFLDLSHAVHHFYCTCIFLPLERYSSTAA